MKNYQNKKNPNIAIVLCGCGAKDGSEITESVTLLVALAQHNYNVSCFAPNRPFFEVIDPMANKKMQESRNQLIEAARIARGKIQPLESLKVEDFDAIAFPGGVGVTKNLCDYARNPENPRLEADVAHTLSSFIKAKKPVGTMCIAPVLLALAAKELGLKNTQLTFGNTTSLPIFEHAKSWGINVKTCHSGQACLDVENRFVSVPAYMIDAANPADIFSCAQALVAGLNTLLDKNSL